MRTQLVVAFLVVCGLTCHQALAVEIRPLIQKDICSDAKIDRDKILHVLVGNLTLEDAKKKTKAKGLVPSPEELILYASTIPTLREFLAHHDRSFYRIGRKNDARCRRAEAVSEYELLTDRTCIVATCLNVPPAAQGPLADPPARTTSLPAEFRLRRNPENLRTKLTAAATDDGKTIPATFSLTRDIEQDSTLAQAELAAGLAFEGYLTEVKRADGEVQQYNPYKLIPYLTYHRIGSDPTKASDINNLGAGLLFNTTLATTAPIGHEITLKGQYTTDDKRRSSIATGEAIYYPLFNLDPVFDPFGGFAWRGPFGVYIEPSVPVRYSEVFDPGDNSVLKTTKEYLFGGGQLMVVLAGNPEVVPAYFQNFKWRFQYIWLHGFDGPLESFERFETELNYSFAELRNFGIGLKYVNGDTDITLQDTESVQGTFNVKF